MRQKLHLTILLAIALLNSCAYGFLNFGKHKKQINIATGSVLEGYYNIGINMCRFLEKSNDDISCNVVPTSGSTENLRLLSRKQVDFAIAQSNIALEGYSGEGFFQGKEPMGNLRQVMSLQNEIFTIIVRDDDRIRYFSDLEGRKITNGSLISASSITYDEIAGLYNLKSRPVDVQLPQEEFARRLCAQDVDSIIIITSHPSDLVSHIANKCEIDFAAIDDDVIEKLIAQNPSYYRTVLRKHEMYPGITEDQASIGVRAILLAHDQVDAKITQNFINYLQNNLKSFKSSHPALSALTPDHINSGFVLPALEGIRLVDQQNAD